MNNYIFTDKNNNHYKRIDKRQAKRAYDAGKTIVLCPCNLRPFGMWAPEVDINKNDFKKMGYDEPLIYPDGSSDMDFKKRLMYFEYYNCTNTETGRYSAFYIQV